MLSKIFLYCSIIDQSLGQRLIMTVMFK